MAISQHQAIRLPRGHQAANEVINSENKHVGITNEEVNVTDFPEVIKQLM